MRSLPGFQFTDRPALFDHLVSLETKVDVPELSLDGRATLLLREPTTARKALSSAFVRKGRSPASARGVGGYVSLGGDRFIPARTDVLAALRRSASDQEGLISSQAYPDTCLALVAHLAGTLPDEAFAELLSAVVHELTVRPHVETDQRRDLVDQLTATLSSTSPFVRELTTRGWPGEAIASEIVALSFAGWSSLAAAIRSAQTLSVTGPTVSSSAISELLRIAPPAWLIVRECTDSLDLGATRVSVGTLLLTSPWLLHRDHRGWSQPTEFGPARRGTRTNPWYLPFSLGKRSCPAELYSRAFLQATLSRLPDQPAADDARPSLLGSRSACLLPA
ncbi:cytochrome P450 [Amycolatopsis sp. lyj-109]|uniref:cytochrome P450 n=1 Tax=Amycolatopsis sp. lyj-109 TaxID=2789287 RepID=UPI00397AF74F